MALAYVDIILPTDWLRDSLIVINFLILSRDNIIALTLLSAFLLYALAFAGFTQSYLRQTARLLASLPVRRSEVVAARYVGGLTCIAVTALAGLVIIWCRYAISGNYSAGMWRSLVAVVVALLVDLVVGPPFVARFRAGWAAGLSLVVGMALPVALGFVVWAGVPALPYDPGQFLVVGGIALGLGALALIPSYRMTARLYARQDH